MKWLGPGLAGLALLAMTAVAVPSSGRVLNRTRARGVRRELQELLDAWELYGTHQVTIPASPWGGLRTSEADQAGYAAGGMSGASTLASTPHGRGAALDVWPVGFEAHVNGTWEAVPDDIKGKFLAFGLFAESRGFTWGGRWRSSSMPNGDQPHVEIAAWRTLPFPPPSGGYS